MPRLSKTRAAAVLFALAAAPCARALEHVTLRNGFEYDCVRRELVDGKMRLFFGTAGTSYLDIAPEAVLRVETLPDPIVAPAQPATTPAAEPSAADLNQLLERSGAAHRIDSDLLLAVVHAESGGHVRAVSRAGARGLMQLMPATAAALGVKDSFAPEQNVEGGTRYLDTLLTRYGDNIALALAAYNAGPGAVDRYHGVPPFRETRAYVARIIGEFNRRKTALLAQAKASR